MWRFVCRGSQGLARRGLRHAGGGTFAPLGTASFSVPLLRASNGTTGESNPKATSGSVVRSPACTPLSPRS